MAQGLTFTALPFNGPVQTAPSAGGGGLDPLFDRLLNAGESFLGRVQDRQDAKLAAQISLRQAAISSDVLAANAAREASFRGGNVPVAATGGTAISSNNLLIAGAVLAAVVLLRK